MERHTYPGTDHLFDDEALDVHDATSSRQSRDHIRSFVAQRA